MMIRNREYAKTEIPPLHHKEIMMKDMRKELNILRLILVLSLLNILCRSLMKPNKIISLMIIEKELCG